MQSRQQLESRAIAPTEWSREWVQHLPAAEGDDASRIAEDESISSCQRERIRGVQLRKAGVARPDPISVQQPDSHESLGRAHVEHMRPLFGELVVPAGER